MITEHIIEDDDFYEAFKDHLKEVDEIANTVLKGHLMIEDALDDILRVIFFHPEHVLEGGFSFERKMRIVRSMMIRFDKVPDWDVISALNALRNNIAHGTKPAVRQQKLDRLIQVSTVNFGEKAAEEHKLVTPHDYVIFACARCAGFLAVAEDSLASMRRRLDEIDEELHPDSVRVAIPPRDE